MFRVVRSNLLRKRWLGLCGQRGVQTYERKTPIEHVLLRPGMYVGSVDWTTSPQWLFDEDKQTMVKREVKLSPALLKVFDEILVNAADSYQNDKTIDKIEIEANVVDASLKISVANYGQGIPVEKHVREGIYIPELIFGHLLTGSNFNDNATRFTGGSHGYGAKLANIFSRRFEVDIVDAKRALRYQQVWTDNMTNCAPPVITEADDNAKKGYVKITFTPDLLRFGEGSVDFCLPDLQAMLQRRALDVASCLSSVKVYFNSKLLPVTSFHDYIQLFPTFSSSQFEDAAEDAMDTVPPVSPASMPIVGKVGSRWTVGVMASPVGVFEQLSFVNNVWTQRGGSHVQLVLSQLIKAIEKELKKRGHTASASQIKSHIMLFVSCFVENPTFEGQTKDSLLTKAAAFADDCVLPKTFLKDVIAKSGVIERVIVDLEASERSHMASAVSSSGRTKHRQFLDVPKLEDAHFAGTERARECTLILTEGDSAKALAVAGIASTSRDLFGVLPLRGKLLNVRVASRSQVVGNEELLHLCKAMGLNFGKTYKNDLDGLRYGKVMIMADQDADGSHIKGLLINFFHHFWPALLCCEGFLQQFITPIVKVRDRSAPTGLEVFYRVADYSNWMAAQLGAGRRRSDFQVKYYKGLGTSSAAEGREYFSAIDRHRKNFLADGQEGEAIDLAFSKARAADRRQWILDSPALQDEEQLDVAASVVTYSDFVHKELIHFSQSDNVRSIPSAVDGMKRSQRKILFACFQRALVEECKLAQLAGYIAEHTAYHHGEASLHSTIINMAQSFVGSNNIPVLEGVGQFGTRARGGGDSASARYIFTKLSPLARLLYPAEDDQLLERLEEDGMTVEPKHFLPVLPMLLVNGSTGIGTGWSTFVPCFHPMYLVDAIERRLDGQDVREPLQPWYRGFRGHVVADAGKGFLTEGIARRLSKTCIEVTELPVSKWTEDYKQQLCTLVEAGAIRDFKEFHGADHVRFEIYATKGLLDQMEADGLVHALKLHSSLSFNNMHAFNAFGKMQKYADPLELVDAHFDVRYQGYTDRMALLQRQHTWKHDISQAKSNFVQDILSRRISLQAGCSQSELSATLRARGYKTLDEMRSKLHTMDSVPNNSTGFDYLLQMPLQSLTDEHAQGLQKEALQAQTSLAAIAASNESDLWRADLRKLRKGWTKFHHENEPK